MLFIDYSYIMDLFTFIIDIKKNGYHYGIDFFFTNYIILYLYYEILNKQ